MLETGQKEQLRLQAPQIFNSKIEKQKFKDELLGIGKRTKFVEAIRIALASMNGIFNR